MTTTIRSQIEVFSVISDRAVKAYLWGIYNTAFKKIDAECPCKQSYDKREFLLVLSDPCVLKFIFKEDDQITGLGLMTNNLKKVPWISLNYYKIHYPVEYKARSIYYIKCLMVAENCGNSLVCIKTILNEMFSIIPNGGIGCFDFSSGTNGRMGSMVQRLYGDSLEGKVLDSQVYQAFRFHKEL